MDTLRYTNHCGTITRCRDAIGHQCSCGDDFILPWPSATEVAEVLSTLRKTRDPNVKNGFTKKNFQIYIYIYIYTYNRYIDNLWKCWGRFCASIYFHLCETTKSQSCWSFDRMLPSPFRTTRVLSYPFLGKGRLIRNLYYGILSAMVSAVSPSSVTPFPPHLWHQNPPDLPSSATPFPLICNTIWF